MVFKKQLTVLAGDVTGGPLTNFPLLVSITDTDLKENARSDGFDIFFTKSDGTTVIPYERESYDNTSGELIAWVLTDLSDTVDNNFFMFYGNPNATDQQNPTAVWSPRSIADVFHFNQSSFPWLNSTTGADFSVDLGTIPSVSLDGQVGTCASYETEQTAFRMPNSPPIQTTDFYFSFWTKFDVISNLFLNVLFLFESRTRALGTSTLEIRTQIATLGQSGFLFAFLSDGLTGKVAIFIGDISDLLFHHIAIRYTSSTTTFDTFFDGALLASNSFTFEFPINFNPVIIADGIMFNDNLTEGRIDELQIAHNSNFSNGYIQTSFNNQKTSGQGAGNFVKVGTQQIIISNNYLVLSQGSIDHEASSIINAVCGDSSLLIGDAVRLLPVGTGEGFTQSDDLLPRVGRVNSNGAASFGIIVGGDFEGVYDSELTTERIAAFFEDGVRVCTQGRCLALANGSSSTIGIGDKLISSTTGALLKSTMGNPIATSLGISDLNNIIAVDVQREKRIPFSPVGSHARFHASGTQSFPGTANTFTAFTPTMVEDFDANELVSESSGTFTINETGKIFIISYIENVNTNFSNDRNVMFSRILLNNTEIEGSRGQSYTNRLVSDRGGMKAYCVLDVTQNDNITFEWERGTDTSAPLGGSVADSTFFHFIRFPDEADVAWGIYNDTSDTSSFAGQTFTSVTWDTNVVQNDTLVIEKQAGNSAITLKETGRYFVSYNIPMNVTAGIDRTQRISRATLGGTEIEGSRQYTYLRNLDSGFGCLTCWFLVNNTTINQDLVIQMQRGDADIDGTVARITNVSQLVVMKLPDQAETYMAENSTTTDEFNGPSTITHNLDVIVNQNDATAFIKNGNDGMDCVKNMNIVCTGNIFVNKLIGNQRNDRAVQSNIETVVQTQGRDVTYLRGGTPDVTLNCAANAGSCYEVLSNDTIQIQSLPASVDVGDDDDETVANVCGMFAINLDSLSE